MRKLVRALEGATEVRGKAFPNPWFNFLAVLPPGPCLWRENAHGWGYQRDPRDGNRDGGVFGPGNRVFHRERVMLADGSFTEPVDMTHQLDIVLKNHFKVIVHVNDYPRGLLADGTLEPPRPLPVHKKKIEWMRKGGAPDGTN
jgi:hypothetical protein